MVSFQKKMKIAVITPIFKKGDPKSFTNYRPVSVLPVFSKILEKLMHTRIASFIDKYEILYLNQFGFREHRSTELAVLTFVEKLRKAIDMGKFGIGLFLDFSKAFDTVNHDILLQKLNFYGIRGTANDWIKSYLSNRIQMTQYNGILSSETLVKCGVPQGSVLGPLFFILYINDIYLTSPDLCFVLFADDTNALVTGNNLKDLQLIVNRGLIKIQDWLSSNKLVLNIDKTKIIVFSSSRKFCDRQQVKITLGDKRLEVVNKTNFLGLIIDENLDWKAHINQIKVKTSRIIGILFRTKHLFHRKVMLSIYYSLIFSYLNYCNLVWGGVAKSNLICLLTIQKKFARLSTNSNYDEHAAPLMRQLKILNIFDIFKVNQSIFFYKWKNNIYGISKLFPGYFKMNNEIHRYNTRNRNDYIKPKYNNKYGKESISYTAAEMWNSLNAELKQSKSVFQFKSKLKTNLLNSYD